MARIKRTDIYNIDPTPSLLDYVIGTDAQDSLRTKNYLIGNLLDLLTGSGASNGILSGGVTWLQLLQFEVTELSYIIGETFYVADGTIVTLAPADPTNPRIDLIVVDTDGNIYSITGIPAVNPVKPVIADNSLELEITSAEVAAGATVPTGIVADLVYDENAGTVGGEWNATENTVGIRINLVSTVQPNTGTISIAATSPLIAGGDTITFADITTTAVSDLSTVHFYIYLVNPVTATSLLKVRFFNGGMIASDIISIKSGSYGFDASVIGIYQSIILPTSEFSFTNTDIDVITFEFEEFPTGTYYIDTFNLITGLSNPASVDNFLGLSDTPSSYTGQAGQGLVVNSAETGLEFGSVSGVFLPLAGGTMTGDLTSLNIIPVDGPVLNIGNTTTSYSSIYGRAYNIKSIVGADIDWLISPNQADGSLAFASEDSPGTGILNTKYTLNDSGTPTNNLDLITKVFADTNYLQTLGEVMTVENVASTFLDMNGQQILDVSSLLFNNTLNGVNIADTGFGPGAGRGAIAFVSGGIRFADDTNTANFRVDYGALTVQADLVATNSDLTYNGTSLLPSGSFLPLAGGTMTGNILLGANDITNGGNISSAVFQVYGAGIGLDLTGWQFTAEGSTFNSSARMLIKTEQTGGEYTNEYGLAWGGTPIAATDLVTKAYADALGGNFVTIDTPQTITGNKIFDTLSTIFNQGTTMGDGFTTTGNPAVSGNRINFTDLTTPGNLQAATYASLSFTSGNLNINKPGSDTADTRYQLASSNTAARTYTLQDADGTLAFLSNLGGIVGIEATAFTNSGTSAEIAATVTTATDLSTATNDAFKIRAAGTMTGAGTKIVNITIDLDTGSQGMNVSSFISVTTNGSWIIDVLMVRTSATEFMFNSDSNYHTVTGPSSRTTPGSGTGSTLTFLGKALVFECTISSTVASTLTLTNFSVEFVPAL